MWEFLVFALWLGINRWLSAWINGGEWSYSNLLVMSQAREMINAHLFPILAVVATVSSVSVAISLRPIAQHSVRWNLCYSDSIAWYQANKPDWTVQDKEVFASNFCNGGTPVKPGAGFKPASWSWIVGWFLLCPSPLILTGMVTGDLFTTIDVGCCFNDLSRRE